MLNKIIFWLWYTEIASRLRNNPLGAFVWETRVQLVYKPLFKKEGLQVVFQEHARHVAHLTQDAPDLGESSASDSESKPAPKRVI